MGLPSPSPSVPPPPGGGSRRQGKGPPPEGLPRKRLGSFSPRQPGADVQCKAGLARAGHAAQNGQCRRNWGDLSENSEYDEAKNTQGLVENRITELEQMVKNAVVIDESELSVENVSVGTHVTIQMEGEDEVEEYDIVGRTEADPLNGKISDESPVGHALLEKAVGDVAEVLLPTGHTVNYKVLGITHAAN